MNRIQRHALYRKVFLAIWAMATVILAVCVVLLAKEMIDRGYQPLPAPGEDAPTFTTEQVRPDASVGRRVSLYFAGPEARALAVEERELQLTPHTQENARIALEALIAGPTQGLTPVLPPSVKVRSVFLLEDGELVLDFSQELQTDPVRPRSASADALLIQGIAHTLAQNGLRGQGDRAVRRLRILFEGTPLSEQFSFPEHLDLTGTVVPDPAWVATQGLADVYGQ